MGNSTPFSNPLLPSCYSPFGISMRVLWNTFFYLTEQFLRSEAKHRDTTSCKGIAKYSTRVNAMYYFACRKMFGIPGTSEENAL